jgi:hypothetical protein
MIVLFPKLKIELKGRRFETADIEKEWQAILNSNKGNDLHGPLETLRGGGQGDRCILSQRGVILKEKAARIE